MTDATRRDAIAQWLQQHDEELLYTPDGGNWLEDISHLYVLEGQIPVPAPDLFTWSRLFESTDRTVARTEIRPGLEVSTVFLGMDHAFHPGPPLLFETMVFQDDHSWDWQERYPTWAEAEQGHQAMCERMRAGLTWEDIDE